MSEKRQLAAIMFTDIVGYTAIMGESETKAYKLLKKNRQIQKAFIKKHRGKWLKEMGDGVLASFQTISDAVYCAIDIQQKCKEESDLKIRIGIHQGEVIVEKDDVFGDGVNIASRIETLAPVGGIFVSEPVYRNIENKEGIKSDFIKEATLKNVKHHIKIYEVDVDSSVVPDRLGNNRFEHMKSIPNWKRPVLWILFILILVVTTYFLYQETSRVESVLDQTPMIERDKSIAVLPFSNLSNDPNQDYFTDGMMEEILNHLFKIGDLQITSRTSVMRYVGTTKTIPEIARELGVSNILLGSVQKSGDRIRIIVQLIDGFTDNYLLSETYDRDLDDVFAIQSEIAKTIAQALKAEISPQVNKMLDLIPTNNLEAYNFFLKAVGSLETVYTVSVPTEETFAYLKEAIKVDSSFAEAYAMLGTETLFLAGFISDKSPSEVGMEAKSYLDKALLVDPVNGLAHTSMGNYFTWYAKDFNQAELHYRLGIELAPSNQSSYVTYMDLLASMGRFDEALKYGEKILEIDGSNYDYWARHAMICAFAGDAEKMLESSTKALEADADFILPFLECARAYFVMNKYNRVLEILKGRDNLSLIPRTMGLKSIAYLKVGDQDNHLKEFNSLIQRTAETAGGSPSFYVAMVYASKGERDEAFKWLDKSFENNEVELYWLKVEPEFETIRSDPRWQEMLEKVGFPK